MKNKKIIYAGLAIIFVSAILTVIISGLGTSIRERLSGESTDTYTACGCGACGGMQPVEKEIQNRDEFDRLKNEDEALKSNPKVCALAGCSVCYKYILKS